MAEGLERLKGRWLPGLLSKYLRNADLVQVDDSKQVNGHTNGTADGAGVGVGEHEDSDDDKDDEAGHADAGASGGKLLNVRLSSPSILSCQSRKEKEEEKTQEEEGRLR